MKRHPFVSRPTVLGFLAIAFAVMMGSAYGQDTDRFPTEADVLGLKRNFLHDRIDMEDKARPLGDINRGCIGGGTGLCERVTFSETVSYVLFALVLEIPGETREDLARNERDFLNVWRWAKENLQRRNLEEVFSWDCQDERFPGQLNPFFKQWVKVTDLDPPASTTSDVKNFAGNLDWFAHKTDNLMAWRWVPKLAGGKKGGVPYMRQKTVLAPLASVPESDRLAITTCGQHIESVKESLIWQDGHQVATDGDLLTAYALYLAAENGWGDDQLTNEILRADAVDIIRDLRKKAIYPFVPGEVFNAERERFFNIVYGITDDRIGRLDVTRSAEGVKFIKFKGNRFYISWWHEPSLDLSDIREIRVELRGRGKFRVALEDTLDECGPIEPPESGKCPKPMCCPLETAQERQPNCSAPLDLPAYKICTVDALNTLAAITEKSGCKVGHQVESAWSAIDSETRFASHTFSIAGFREGRDYGRTDGKIDLRRVKNIKLVVESRDEAEIDLKRIVLIPKTRRSTKPITYLLSNAHGDLRINVSYFMPFAYPVFAALDSHKSGPAQANLWLSLLDDTYEVLDRSMKVTLCKKESARCGDNTGVCAKRLECAEPVVGDDILFPNWVNVDLVTGDMIDTVYHDRDDYLFGWDAFRTLWFLSFSELILKQQHGDNSDRTGYRELLQRSAKFFRKRLNGEEKQGNGRLAALYDISGNEIAETRCARNRDTGRYNLRDGEALYPVYLSLFDQLGDEDSARKIRSILEHMVEPDGDRVWLNYPGDECAKSNYYKGFWSFLGAYLDLLINCKHGKCMEIMQFLQGTAASDRLSGGAGDDTLKESIRPEEDWTKSLRPELFLDFNHREEEARDNKKTDFTDQSLVRFDARLGFSPWPIGSIAHTADVTPFITVSGAQSREDSFSFENNVQPGVGAWVRPLRPLVPDDPIYDLVDDMRVIATYSWNTYYTRDRRNEFDQDGNVFKAALDWYGETPLWPTVNYEPRVSVYIDTFSQYAHAQKGPSNLFRWFSRSGLAVDAGLSRIRVYPRFNGAYGFDSKEPFFNTYELGGGIAFQPIYNIRGEELGWFGKEFLRSMRVYGEYVNVSYMDRHNRRFFDSQVDSYWRFGLEFWGGRN